jgi:hypothetical protein
LSLALKTQKYNRKPYNQAFGDAGYTPLPELLGRNRHLESLSPAMKEYHSTPTFSPELEIKKHENLNNFFIVVKK